MKKYEGITLPTYRPWDLEKFQARPARPGTGGSQNTSLGGRRREERHETCQNRSSYAYSINGDISSNRISNITSISLAELLAISSCLTHISQLSPNGKFILLSDSLSSLRLIVDPYNANPLIQRIHLILHSLNPINTRVTFIWLPGHINLIEHDTVDLAAKQASSLQIITDHSLIPSLDYKIHFRSLILQQWHYFWKNQSTNKI